MVLGCGPWPAPLRNQPGNLMSSPCRRTHPQTLTPPRPISGLVPAAPRCLAGTLGTLGTPGQVGGYVPKRCLPLYTRLHAPLPSRVGYCGGRVGAPAGEQAYVHTGWGAAPIADSSGLTTHCWPVCGGGGEAGSSGWAPCGFYPHSHAGHMQCMPPDDDALSGLGAHPTGRVNQSIRPTIPLGSRHHHRHPTQTWGSQHSKAVLPGQRGPPYPLRASLCL